MKVRWFHTASCSYAAAEDGTWRGHWIGRAYGPSGKGWRGVRGLSFASRRRGRVWAFWIGREAPKATPWEARVAVDIERCGWRVQRAYSLLPDQPDAIRVSGRGLSFFLPVDLYDGCNDADFAAVCEAKRQMIEQEHRGGRLRASLTGEIGPNPYAQPDRRPGAVEWGVSFPDEAR